MIKNDANVAILKYTDKKNPDLAIWNFRRWGCVLF
jgi:hypothetical protein